MYKYQTNMLKITQISKGFFSIIGLISLISLSIVTVLYLNPRSKIEAKDTVTNVLGISTKGANLIPIKINNINKNKYTSSNLNLVNSNGEYNYTLTVLPSDSTDITFDLISATNNNDIDQNLYIETSVIGLVQQNINVYLNDGIDKILLYSPTIPFISQKINIPRSSINNFKLDIVSNDIINFPYTLKFKLF